MTHLENQPPPSEADPRLDTETLLLEPFICELSLFSMMETFALVAYLLVLPSKLELLTAEEPLDLVAADFLALAGADGVDFLSALAAVDRDGVVRSGFKIKHQLL